MKLSKKMGKRSQKKVKEGLKKAERRQPSSFPLYTFLRVKVV